MNLIALLLLSAMTSADPIEVGKAYDGLAEVNRQRAQKGLKPYVYDEGLARAAAGCATFRAERFRQGHCGGQMGDFTALPPGTHAKASGCAAWETPCRFGACALYDKSYTYCGAAWVIGKDGKRYMHAFYR